MLLVVFGVQTLAAAQVRAGRSLPSQSPPGPGWGAQGLTRPPLPLFLPGPQDAEETAAEEKEEAEEAMGALEDGRGIALIASTFSLVFAAEWGDKSFISTIALAAGTCSFPYTAIALWPA